MIRVAVMALVLTVLAWLLVTGIAQTARPSCPVPVCLKA